MPKSEPPVLLAERRSRKYWSQDGIPSIVGGLACIGMTVIIFQLQSLPSRSWQGWLLRSSAFVLMLLAFTRLRAVSEWLKARYVWPRTGYAAPPPETDMTASNPPEVLSIMSPAPLAATLQRTRRRRAVRNGAFAVLAGAMIPYAARHAPFGLPDDRQHFVGWIAIGVGTAVAAHGAFRFIRFLRRHPLEQA